MKVELYCHPDNVQDWPENEGLYGQQPERLLVRVREAGVEYAVIDVSGLSREALEDIYTRLAVVPSVRKRYGIRRIFGTNKCPGAFFGKSVPALVVLENGRPEDVYPHEERGRIVTIKDYIDRLAAGDLARARRDLAKRMDALRARIGPIGVGVRDLIEDGRRR